MGFIIMSTKTTSRKTDMMNKSYAINGSLTFAYIGVMYNLGLPPDPLVVTAAFAALGVGHGTANWANGREHTRC